MIGIGLVPTDNVEEGVREAQRVAKLGMRGLLVSSFPKSGLLSSEVFDPLWAAAQDLGLPIHLHLAVGDTRGKVFTEQRNVRGLMPGQILINSMGNMEALARLLFGGIGELFPKLKIVSVEGNIGWIPYFLERADRIYQRHRYWSRLELPMPPSEYFRRQVYATFIQDRAGIRLRDLIGVDNLMWSSDYPHTDTTWPNSVKCNRGDAGRRSGRRKAQDRRRQRRPALRVRLMLAGHRLLLWERVFPSPTFRFGIPKPQHPSPPPAFRRLPWSLSCRPRKKLFASR